MGKGSSGGGVASGLAMLSCMSGSLEVWCDGMVIEDLCLLFVRWDEMWLKISYGKTLTAAGIVADTGDRRDWDYGQLGTLKAIEIQGSERESSIIREIGGWYFSCTTNGRREDLGALNEHACA